MLSIDITYTDKSYEQITAPDTAIEMMTSTHGPLCGWDEAGLSVVIPQTAFHKLTINAARRPTED